MHSKTVSSTGINEPSLEQVIASLEHFDGKYKRAEVDLALAQREQIIPRLIRILEDVLAEPAAYAARKDYSGHIYAIMLLGHFGEKRAHRLITQLAALPDDLPHSLFGDIITEDLAVILLRTSGGSFTDIEELAQNTSADEYCRGAAAKAIAYSVADGVLTRQDALSLLENWLLVDGADGYTTFRSTVAGCIARLYPGESMDVISEAFDQGWIDFLYINPDDFERALEKGEAQCLEELKRGLAADSLDNIHDAMSWWACFNDTNSRPLRQMATPSGQKTDNKKRKQKKTRKAIAKASRKRNRRKK